MSRFFSTKYQQLIPYTPGEQPKDKKFIKLNTNESPFPPSEKAVKMAALAAKQLQLYCEPSCSALTERLSRLYNLDEEEILFTNGSDEALLFSFMAFCDKGAIFPDITYGFYSVFAGLCAVPFTQLPLKKDFSIDLNDYMERKETVFIANPNAPTGLALSMQELERLIAFNPDRLIVVDEAYVDFGAESCVPLIRKYDNLLITQTFSKSRSMAGARLGMALGNKALIRDLNTVKYSTNPYNVNTMTQAAGIGVLEDEPYTQKNLQIIRETRAQTANALRSLGFIQTASQANFLFVKHPKVSGKTIYEKLREKGILVRHFDKPRLSDFNRITVGAPEEMRQLTAALKEILEETP